MSPADFHLRRSGIGWKLWANEKYFLGDYRPWWAVLPDRSVRREWYFTRRGALWKLRRTLRASREVVAITRDGSVNRVPVTDLRAS